MCSPGLGHGTTPVLWHWCRHLDLCTHAYQHFPADLGQTCLFFFSSKGTSESLPTLKISWSFSYWCVGILHIFWSFIHGWWYVLQIPFPSLWLTFSQWPFLQWFHPAGATCQSITPAEVHNKGTWSPNLKKRDLSFSPWAFSRFLLHLWVKIAPSLS